MSTKGLNRGFLMSYNITGDLLLNLRSINGKLYNCTDKNLYKSISTFSSLDSYTTKLSQHSIFPSRIKTAFKVYFKKPKTLPSAPSKYTLSFWMYQKTSIFNISNFNYTGAGLSSEERFTSKPSGCACRMAIHTGAKAGIFFQQADMFEYDVSNPNTIHYIFNIFTSGIEEPINQWTHYAFVRDNNTTYIFRNGNIIYTRPINYTPAVYGPTYLNIYECDSAEFYLDDIVYIENQALWTSNFTVPNEYITGPYTGTLSKRKSVIPEYNPLYQDKAFLY